MATLFRRLVFVFLILTCLIPLNESTSSDRKRSNDKKSLIQQLQDHQSLAEHIKEKNSVKQKFKRLVSNIKDGIKGEYKYIADKLNGKPLRNWLFNHEMKWIEGILSAYISGATTNMRQCFELRLQKYLSFLEMNEKVAQIELERQYSTDQSLHNEGLRDHSEST